MVLTRKVTAVFLLVSASNSVPSPSMQQNIEVLCSSFHSRVLSHKQLFEVRQIVTFAVWAGMFGTANAALSSLIALHTHAGVHLEGAWGGIHGKASLDHLEGTQACSNKFLNTNAYMHTSLHTPQPSCAPARYCSSLTHYYILVLQRMLAISIALSFL